ncbi:orotidine-5'-phosphate decarboxylase [Candidatus Parcubacteria bacterium]|nr:orotidine-5'-phosphate decarboxylase [Candidatus Parcubacteria bacterium]
MIIVSLDNISKDRAIKIARSLEGMVWGFKINDLLLEHGAGLVRELKKFGKVFCDPKLFDIPNTVLNSVKMLDKAGADLITVHVSSPDILKAAVSASKNIVGVIHLTSEGAIDKKLFLSKALLAKRVGIKHLVCSVQELGYLKGDARFRNIKMIVPGIRPEWHKNKDDQKRVGTPKKALSLGADFLVIGRPITQSKNPPQALRRILEN